MRPDRGVLGRGQRDRGQPDRGSATVLAMGIIAVLLSLTAAGLVLASAMIASHRARTGADLAALAGAAAVIRGEPAAAACGQAREVAQLNGGQLTRCAVSGSAVELVVEVRAGVHRAGTAVARGRAGPPEPP